MIPTVYFNPRGPMEARAFMDLWSQGKINLLMVSMEAAPPSLATIRGEDKPEKEKNHPSKTL